MKILIDIGHPLDCHIFRHFAAVMQARGHVLQFTCRQKEFTTALLTAFGLPYVSFGRSRKTLVGKLLGLVVFNIRMWGVARRFRPDIFVSTGSMYAAQVAWLMRRPHIALEDTFNREQLWLYMPFTKTVLVGDYDNPLLGRKKAVAYAGYHELAYLHPDRFVPDAGIRSELGLQPGEKLVILRFVAWQASHDIGHSGLSEATKLRAAEAFAQHARVFISSEAPLTPALQRYRFPLPPIRMHHAMAAASLVFGESATMATEAAMLGIPAIYIDNTGRYYTRDLAQNHHLIFNYSESAADQNRAIDKGLELLQTPGIAAEWQARRQAMLQHKIDVTDYLANFIEKK